MCLQCETHQIPVGLVSTNPVWLLQGLWCVCMSKSGGRVVIAFRRHMTEIKRRLALNVPSLECLPLTRAAMENKRVVKGAAHTHTHT